MRGRGRARPTISRPCGRYLEKTLELSREYAGFFAPYDRIADPLIDDADEGMTTASIQKLFAELRRELVPIVRAIAAQPVADDRCLRGAFGEAHAACVQPSMSPPVSATTSIAAVSTRRTIRSARSSAPATCASPRACARTISATRCSRPCTKPATPCTSRASSAALDGTPLGSGVSAGVHESQSRLWENVVGRGRAFWEHFFPALQRLFPDQFEGVPLDTFYRAINKVERSLIRTDADEVTYNLHVMMRFDLELDLLEGRLAVKDMPDAWRARMQADLGIEPPDDRDGCLQDVHWYGGGIGGGFQGYTIGNILERAVLCRGGQGQARHPVRDRGGRIRHAARLAHRQPLPARPQVHAERADQARDRRADDHAALSRLPAQQVRRALFVAGGGVITSSLSAPCYRPAARATMGERTGRTSCASGRV